jgi:ribosomal protein S16
MPRRIRGAVEDAAYRAVVTTTYTYRDGSTSERVDLFGPYSTPAPARGRVTAAHREAERATSYARHVYGSRPSRPTDVVARSTEGHVEVSEIAWRPL